MARDTGWLGSATQLTRKMSDGPEVMEEDEYTNPINPGHSLVDCADCDGTGDIAHQEEYDSITDAQNDYPRARFTYVQSPIR